MSNVKGIRIGLVVNKGSGKKNYWIDKDAHKKFVERLFAIKDRNKI